MRFSKRRSKGQGTGESSAVPGQTSFEWALQLYLLAHQAIGRSSSTIKDYEVVLRLFFRFLAERGKTTIESVEAEDFYAWLVQLRQGVSRRGEFYSRRTLRSYGNYVGIFFRWLVKQGYLQRNPLEGVPTPQAGKPLIRVFTDEELEKLDAACERLDSRGALTSDECKALAARDRAILWMLLSTGIRVSELCRLRLTDIDWEQSMLFIEGKGSKERRVPFGKIARQYLVTYLQFWRGEPEEPGDRVFLSVSGRPLSCKGVQGLFERLKRRAGITDKRVSPHICRHWFAVTCLKRGMPVTVLQMLLGHESMEMLKVYLQLADRDKQEFYARYSPVDALEMHRPDRRRQLRAWRQARRRSRSRSTDH